MPPKPAARGGAAKTVTKTPAKSGASKSGATGTKTGAKTGGTASKGATKGTDIKKVEDEMAKVSIKQIVVPENIKLKDVAGLLTPDGSEGIGKKIKDSNKWPFLIDHTDGYNSQTFFKYRDVNMLSVFPEFHKETLRKALMGALRFGKPLIIDVKQPDQSTVMDRVRDTCNDIYNGLWDDIMDRSILDFEKCGKLYQPSDDLEYKNSYDYRVSDFQFIVLTNVDPPSSAMDSFFPVTVE
ncbi:IQ motif and ankyrin repeat domain-containing protein 1-like [Mercenaria mercenaria]|uniref:IQ motif and ankyrin repeat domain-containing protein 1-like n=1 Tax=Mercenaria mercenaria TaxID=6596 RepID=UPI001E1DA7A6|nr:IQ motif and ankyrin repeat domain-containing protein 1-like [Mercenaria mercenaria]